MPEHSIMNITHIMYALIQHYNTSINSYDRSNQDYSFLYICIDITGNCCYRQIV